MAINFAILLMLSFRVFEYDTDLIIIRNLNVILHEVNLSLLEFCFGM